LILGFGISWFLGDIEGHKARFAKKRDRG